MEIWDETIGRSEEQEQGSVNGDTTDLDVN